MINKNCTKSITVANNRFYSILTIKTDENPSIPNQLSKETDENLQFNHKF